jgi:hypothetical protein
MVYSLSLRKPALTHSLTLASPSFIPKALAFMLIFKESVPSGKFPSKTLIALSLLLYVEPGGFYFVVFHL